MMPQEEWDDILLYLADQRSLGLACARLERLAGPWPSGLGQLKQAMALASQQGVHEFFLLYLISRVLLAGKQAPAWIGNWLRQNRILDWVLPGLSFRTAMSHNWLAVPVSTVGLDGRGGIFRMMLAMRRDGQEMVMPQWARESLDSECLEAIRKAMAAAANQGFTQGTRVGFYCWPMLDPKGPMLRGESLGLPLAMAMCLLDKGLPWPATLMATGNIDEAGEVRPVGGLEAKVQVAASSGVRLFLYPDDEKIDLAEWPIPALPVKDLGQAMTFAQLVTLGLPESSNFRLYYACLHDANLLLDNFHQIPPTLLQWARDRGLLAKLEERACETEGFAHLEDRLSDSSLSIEHKEILASLLSDERLESLAARSSQDALMASNWYRCLVELAQEKGDAEQAAAWERKASKLLRAFGNKIYVFYRTTDHQRCYAQFDREFGRCLRTMKDGPLSRLVERAWSRKLIFLHLPIRREDDVSARVFFSEDNKVRALSLNALNLEVDPEYGEANDMANCVHAVYLGLIRAAYVINREALFADDRLHRLLAGYLLGMVMEAVEGANAQAVAEAGAWRAACDYYYAQRFLGLEHEQALAWLDGPDRAFWGGRAAPPEALTEACPPPKGWRPLGQLSRLVCELGLAAQADWLQNLLAAKLEREALSSLEGVVDHFMGLCLISSHRAEGFLGALPALPGISREVENILLPCLERIEFAPEVESAQEQA